MLLSRLDPKGPMRGIEHTLWASERLGKLRGSQPTWRAASCSRYSGGHTSGRVDKACPTCRQRGNTKGDSTQLLLEGAAREHGPKDSWA
jgi:hypothetical protein